MLATNLSTCPSAKDKLKWAFKLYDKDESGFIWPLFIGTHRNHDHCLIVLHFVGYIDLEELLEVVKTFYSMEGVPKEAAKTKAEAIFKTLDTNGDGTLDEDEFCEGCLNDVEFANMIQVRLGKLLF